MQVTKYTDRKNGRPLHGAAPIVLFSILGLEIAVDIDNTDHLSVNEFLQTETEQLTAIF